jgi:hypothetical protein
MVTPLLELTEVAGAMGVSGIVITVYGKLL